MHSRIWNELDLSCSEMDGEEASFQLWFETLQRLSLAERKWETIPDDRASVRKKALPLECFASDRIAEDEWRDREGCTAEEDLQNIEAQNLITL